MSLRSWLYVLDGTPVLRDSGGRRVLAPADVVCFPPGHRGAHTLEGPGRFIIFSGERSSGPFVSVYPDSDKVSVSPGIEPDQLNALRLPRSGSVDYWDREGHGETPPAAVKREPEGAPGPPIISTNGLELAPQAGRRRALLGDRAGARRLDGAVLELDPGADDGAYRYEHGRELWLLVTAGELTVQTATGERPLSRGDLACFPDGPAGGRRLLNHSPATARMLLLWTTGLPAAECHPDTGGWILRLAPDAEEVRLYHR